MKQTVKFTYGTPHVGILPKGTLMRQKDPSVMVVVLEHRGSNSLFKGMVVASDPESLPVGYISECFDSSCWTPCIGDVTIHCEP